MYYHPIQSRVSKNAIFNGQKENWRSEKYGSKSLTREVRRRINHTLKETQTILSKGRGIRDQIFTPIESLSSHIRWRQKY